MTMSAALSHISLAVFDTAAEAERETASVIRNFVEGETAPVLGLATGRTMIAVYDRLAQWHRDGALSFAACTSFNLDEYCGLGPDHPASFASYMRQHLFDRIDIRPGSWHMPDPDDPGAAYEAMIRRAGGVGLQLLGVGRNGHIGFNEPGAERESRTRVVELDPSTRRANQRDFPAGEAVPTHAVTMGIATILDAREIVLLATGAEKADAVRRAVHGPVTADCPGSFLQLHRRVRIICDRAAAQGA